MKSIKEISRDIAFYSKGHMRELDRLLRVWGFAREIADGEALSRRERYALEVAALTHNIAYPLCRETYGSEDPALQAREGAALVRDFLRDADMPAEQLERIVYLVSRHHSKEPAEDHCVRSRKTHTARRGQNGDENVVSNKKRNCGSKIDTGTLSLRDLSPPA